MRMFSKLWKAGSIVAVILSFFVSSVVWGQDEQNKQDNLTDSQKMYLQAVKLYKNGKVKEARAISSMLSKYVLYPYLKYYDLYYAAGPSRVPEVLKYLSATKHEGLKGDLQARYIRVLYASGNYGDMFKIRTKPFRMLGLNCLINSARYKTGQKKQAYSFMTAEYLKGDRLPGECDFLLNQLRNDGVLTYATSYTKMLRKFRVRRQNDYIKALAKELNGTVYSRSAQIVNYLYSKPDQVLEKLDQNVSGYQSVAVGSILLQARINADVAYDLLPKVVKKFKLTPDQIQECHSYIIRHMMEQKRTAHKKWLDRELPKLRHPDDLIQNRVKLAIWQHNWNDLSFWLKKLSPKEAKDSKWIYWRAYALEKQGKAAEAREMYLKILSDRSFYSFMVSQKYSIPWPFMEQRVWLSPLDEKKALAKWTEFARVKELLAVGDITNAGREWYYFITRLTPHEAAEAGVLAYNKGWYDYSLKACIYGKAWNMLSLRFPMPMKDYYQKISGETGVSLSLLYAISRQESALNPNAVSPVGAKGMMQLMPATASMVARKYHIPYSGESQLLDPETNISLGAHYLQDLLAGYDGNRILAATAYNAGPHRVAAWLSKGEKKQSVDVWVENIPYKETRNYVQNVIIFDAIYQKYLKEEPYFLTDKEFNFGY